MANTADDLWLHGLKICPDLDTVMYTLGDGIDHDRGWGRRDETWSVKEELAAYGAEAPWFGLGDRDIATHLMRTRMLEAGYPLSEVTEALCARWLSPVSGGAAAADERRPGRDARGDRRRRRAERPTRRALPGVLGAPARRGARRDRRRGRARHVDAGAGRAGGHRRGRRGRRAAVQPRGLRRHDPRGAGHPRRAAHDGRSGRGPLPHRRRHARARDGPAAADLHRGRGLGRRRRRALRRPLARRGPRRLAGRRRSTPRWCLASRMAGLPAAPSR